MIGTACSGSIGMGPLLPKARRAASCSSEPVVRVWPGKMALTAMLYSLTSSARYSDIFISADLDDIYGISRELGRRETQTPLSTGLIALPLDETLTMLPRRF